MFGYKDNFAPIVYTSDCLMDSASGHNTATFDGVLVFLNFVITKLIPIQEGRKSDLLCGFDFGS